MPSFSRRLRWNEFVDLESFTVPTATCERCTSLFAATRSHRDLYREGWQARRKIATPGDLRSGRAHYEGLTSCIIVARTRASSCRATSKVVKIWYEGAETGRCLPQIPDPPATSRNEHLEPASSNLQHPELLQTGNSELCVTTIQDLSTRIITALRNRHTTRSISYMLMR